MSLVKSGAERIIKITQAYMCTFETLVKSLLRRTVSTRQACNDPDVEHIVPAYDKVKPRHDEGPAVDH